MTTRKKVLIIGGGYAGISLAQILDKEPTIDLTIVEAREGFLLHKFAALRAAVVGDDYSDKVMIPTKQTLKNGKVIRGRVIKINDMDKTAILESGNIISFDCVVVATGARNLSPGEPPISMTTVGETKTYYAEMSAAIKKAERIVIYGAGLVGVELCGEIISEYPTKNVILVNGKKHSLAGGVKLTKHQIKTLQTLLDRGNLRFIDKDDVISPELPNENLVNASPLVEVPDGRVKLSSGRTVDANLLITCFGGRLSTFGVFPNGWLSIQTGELKIDPQTFQVKDCDFAFALGDVAIVEHEKLGIHHMSDAATVAANVKTYLQGKSLPKKPAKKSQFVVVSFGRSNGKAFLQGWSFSSLFTNTIKSKDLYVNRTWKTYAGGLKPSTHKWSESIAKQHVEAVKQANGT
jgi:NADH dehydrogenase FAD-containing subunit